MIKVAMNKSLKTIFLFGFQLFSFGIFAQAPALINYQGVVRDDKGQPVINQAIAIRFEVVLSSATGSVVYTDDQLTGLSTNGLGLFSTQIGKNGTLAQVNWQQNQIYYLRISIDPTGGSNLQPLGNPQQIVSVPYAIHAASVPASYTNNVLSVGNKTFVIASTPNTSITVSGIGTVTSTSTNSFDINVPAPTFSNTGQTIISGNYPNYTVNTPTVPAAITPSIAISNTSAAASTVVSSGSSFSINVPPPTFSNTGQNIVTGTYPNYSVNTPTVAGTSIALTATAAAGPSLSTSGTNSFNINIPPSTAWSLLGNAGTSTVSNFIGTTDANDLRFRINNVRAGSIEQSGSTYLGFTTGPVAPAAGANVGIGAQDLSVVTTGLRNVAIGYNNLNVLTTGNYNVGIGGAAQMSNISGSSNVAIGYQSLRNNLVGSDNLALGPNALQNVTGNSNLGVGSSALALNTSGNSNVAIGVNAGFNNISGTANVFLGNNAGYNELGSNKLYIANNSTIAPLIYGDFINNRLAIGVTTANGDLQFSNIINGRKIILWEGANNDHQVYAIGTNVNAMRYQVDAAVASHIFYSGINSTSSQELMRIQGNRRVGINTAAPTATFEVTGTTKLADGTQGAGKILTSDALGNATWQTPTAVTTPSMYAAGIASVSPATGYNFTVTVNQPTFAYSQTNGSLTSGTSSANITPNLTFSNGVISSGPSTNSIAINSGTNAVWSTLGNVGTSTVSNFIGTTDNISLNFRVNNQKAGSINPGGPVFVGYQSGSVNTSSYVTGIGFQALSANTSGDFNTALGYWSQQSNTTGQSNSSFGTFSLRQNTTGNFNTAIGQSVLASNTSGVSNTGLGVTALYSNTTGQNNVAAGVNALYANTLGNLNVAYGSLALEANTTGNNNTAIGTYAMRLQSYNNGGSVFNGENTAIGYQSLYSNQPTSNSNGIQNSALGSYALWGNTTGASNVGLGYRAGYSNLIGSGNVFIGNQAGYYETGDNKLWIANNTNSTTPLIYGDFTNNYIGIGTSTANAPLQFVNSIANRKIVLWEGANNDHQFYGLGINGSTLRYQTDSPGADHVFYSGINATSSLEIFRIKGNGLIKMGTEAGTGQPPNYPTGVNGGGMLIRRLYTTNITAGEIVARTPEIILERDGSNGGWRINNTGTSALSVCNCIGTNSSGAAVNVALNNIVSGTTPIYSNAQNIVFFHCMFGDPYYSLNGHITEVSLTRQASDYFWMGTVTSTFNQ